MPKGRSFAPHTDEDGGWFQHKGSARPLPLLRENSTSTGVMLKAPFDPLTSNYPSMPPLQYRMKQAPNFKTSNRFSAHDNRNALQDHGVYFGNGRDTRLLGKGLSAHEIRQHGTETEMLKHNGRVVCNYDYNTIYGGSYQGNQCTEKPTKRRFSKTYKQPRLAKLDTMTTEWFHPSTYVTPIEVMADSQEPFLGKNSWKYSNQSLSKCYPPYDYSPKKAKPFSPWMLSGMKKAMKATDA
ncbi:hypothetical protein CAPTEDRAFT_226597 [Capitella teleta]|uniref:Domain of unknown function with conserved HDNR motif domain-containing protein n=1 Tax=Capitella teleta TaxID=283909 RepID=R7T9F3_CAPTE|nr:hypothetical protein CAPTEDRAFT_226597 [Capitella teleta]|eukprot:ELT87624.1 hypothetical protein CAPTEDRAFT_226597 [Capitella teleta]